MSHSETVFCHYLFSVIVFVRNCEILRCLHWENQKKPVSAVGKGLKGHQFPPLVHREGTHLTQQVS